MKFIHCSDFHLAAGFVSSPLDPGVAAAHRELLWSSFSRILAECGKSAVDILLISGDLFDAGHARVSDVRRVADSLGALKNTRVFISPGEADAAKPSSYYNVIPFPPNVTVFQKFSCVTVPELNTCVYGFGWQESSYDALPFAFEALNRSKINLLALHADALQEKAGRLPVKAELLDALGFDYVALGGSHLPVQVRPNIYYSGSPQPQGFGEEGSHGYILGELEDKTLNLSYQNLLEREFVTVAVKVAPEMDEAAIRKEISSACGSNTGVSVYRMVFTGVCHPYVSIEAIMKDLKGDFYAVDYYDRTVPDYDIKKIYHDNKDNIIGKFVYSLTQEATRDPIAYKALLSGLEALLYRQEGARWT